MLRQILPHEQTRSTLSHDVYMVTDTTSASDLACANCGTPLNLPGSDVVGVTCPICQLFNPLAARHSVPQITQDTLGARLSALVAQARTSALPLDAIVHVLRDELLFTAELANGERDLCVQIIDLGPRINQPMPQSSRNDHLLPRGRTSGANLR